MGRKKILIFGLIGVVAVLVFLFIAKPENGNQRFEGIGDNFIVANPLDLSQIGAISKFRSCVGHDYSGKNIDGEKESLRSMKHYIEPIRPLSGSSENVKVFAPFDGKISEILDEQSGQGAQVWIGASGWNFIFFHIELLPGLEKGSRVSAGGHIGYAWLQRETNFDIGLKKFSRFSQLFESPFLHMTPEVLAEYEAVGITVENVIVSKEERDNDPCPTVPGDGPDAWFPPGDRQEDWVRLN